MTRDSVRRLVVGLAFLLLISLFLAGCLTAQESEGIMARMAPCPETPNCVSTLSKDEMHSIAPLAFEGPVDEAKTRLLAVIRGMPRTTLVEDDREYIHVEFRSRIFRFVDDVEFLINGTTGVIHYRSASRSGTSDLGVNRNRMETIRKAFSAVQ